MVVSEIPVYESSTAMWGSRVARSHTEWPWERRTRRQFLKAAFLAGAAGSLTVLGRLPTAQAVCTTSEATKIWGGETSGPCGAGGYAQGHGCSGCTPSKICSHCCRSLGIHKNFAQNSLYKHRADECYSGTYDGWEWKETGCACCNVSKIWQCHDGCYNTGSGWVETICRGTEQCTCSGLCCE